MNKRIGFIGCGKMASAIISGIKNSCCSKNITLMGAEVNCEVAELAQDRLGIDVITDNRALVINSDVIFIATKPDCVLNILDEIKDELNTDKLLVSIAAGVSTGKIEKVVGAQRVVRIMPNTPALLQCGMAGVCKGSHASQEDTDFVIDLLVNVGKAVEVTEKAMDLVTAISGSGPAFFYQVIEDMARAGEKLGLDYDKSLLLATQTALGSAKMVENRGELTVQNLIDNVATKGGCTFVGISVMKNEKSDKLFYDVIDETAKKAHALGE